MKIKCNDGIVRRFSPSRCDGDFLKDGTRQSGYSESRCLECGESFGIHDTKILKSKWKEHSCKEEGVK